MVVQLRVDGTRILPSDWRDERMSFRLHLPAQEIRILSGAARPSDITGSDDSRRLGVALKSIAWQRDGVFMPVSVAEPDFMDGFHLIEIPLIGGAAFRWTSGDAAIPPTLFPPWSGETQLHLELGTWAGSVKRTVATAERTVMTGFESLGSNCEFALAQRHYDVSVPLGLFAWASTSPQQLIDGLRTRFAALSDRESIRLVWKVTDYRLETPFLNLHTSVNAQRDEAGEADVLRSGRASLRLLRRKLLEDIQAARRIFVFQTDDRDFGRSAMQSLHDRVRENGPASLLCVTQARDGLSGGEVDRLAEGLYHGALTRFVIPNGPFDEWLRVCSATLALHYTG